MGRCVVRCTGHSLLKVVDALVHLLVVAHQKFAALEIHPIGLGVRSIALREFDLFIPTQAATQRRRDRGGNLAFHLQYIVHRARVLLAPQLRGVLDAHELRADFQARTVLRQVAENQDVDSELLADLDRVHLFAFEGKGRGPRNHMQAMDARQLVDQLSEMPLLRYSLPGSRSHARTATRRACCSPPLEAPSCMQRGRRSSSAAIAAPISTRRDAGCLAAANDSDFSVPRRSALGDCWSGDDSSRVTRSTNFGGAFPAGQHVHCTSRNLSGTSASASVISSMTTGKMNARSVAMRWERSTASFHSSGSSPLRAHWYSRKSPR